MKKLLLLISFATLQLPAFTQIDIQHDNRVNPLLKYAVTFHSGYFVYGNWRLLHLTSSRKGHTIAHELFHNLLHNHKNAPDDIKNQIDPKNQKPGHKKAGGIFVYGDASDGTKEEDIKQKNIQDVLRTLPEKKAENPAPAPAN